MLSRTADALYWMGRNIERAENNARVLNVQLVHMLEASDTSALDRDWKEVLEICASYSDYMERYGRLETGTIIEYLTTSPVQANSMKGCMAIARDNARTTRDILPAELWEVINEFHLDQRGPGGDKDAVTETKDYLKQLMRTSMTAQGVVEASMSRGVPYTFIKIGKWLERAEKTARILNVICEKERSDNGNLQKNSYYYWLAALRFLNGYDAFIKENPPMMQSGQVLKFLVKEETFPRSIAYCVSHVREAITELEGGEVRHYSSRLFDLLKTVETEIHQTAIDDMEMEELMTFLDQFQEQCMALSRVVMETYYLTPPVTVE